MNKFDDGIEINGEFPDENVLVDSYDLIVVR